jgi:molybdenum cofactor cytidylyltransferase
MRIAALILAAGRSRRFGAGNKLLADLEGKPVLAHTLAAVTAAGFDQVLLVTGHDHDAMMEITQRFAIDAIRAPDADEGMGASIAAGVARIAPDIEGLAILPGDMPLVTSHTLHILTQTFVAHAAKSIVHAAGRDGAQRNPVVWPRRYFPQLAALEGDRGAKSLIRDAIAVRISDETELFDIDDAAALAEARTVLRARQAQF